MDGKIFWTSLSYNLKEKNAKITWWILRYILLKFISFCNVQHTVVNIHFTSYFYHVSLDPQSADPASLKPLFFFSKLRLMATRQFLCWMHKGQRLKKEIRMAVPSCVSRAIRMEFPDDTNENSGGSVTDTSMAGVIPLETLD